MIKRNAENERVKRDYLIWMREARGRSEETLDIAAAAIDRFQTHTGYKAFKTFRPEQATSFKADLSRQTSPASGKPLSKATLYGTLKGVQAFFEWLSREPGYRQAVRMSDAEYFTLNRNDARVATATRERPSPSLEQVRHVLSVMPTTTTLERRDRALIAFILLTGMRDAAVISLKLKRLDIGRKQVSQDARDVKTKAAKTFASHFFPVGEDVELIVREWVEELTQTHLFGPDDPVFPATRIGLDPMGQFQATGFGRDHWALANPVRAIFRKAFEAAGLPYFYPHSLRRTLMRLAYDLELSPRELKAWSQSLGHESPLTSLGSYGALSREEQGDVMAHIAVRKSDPDAATEETLRQMMALLARRRS
ncbi:site-specific integrase [Phenylobacterium sp. 20VBR1]|uniref:Site-specific integrase n=2 Tax=Phenylobacterium glaciei TaxID=2803784 RepID=A0A941HV02_9CAUL|nr:site-specific integrase [Phenylobacterium glaciei]MBR7618120.1 site-specific integrase [Phenylobacterium glaciei]